VFINLVGLFRIYKCYCYDITRLVVLMFVCSRQLCGRKLTANFEIVYFYLLVLHPVAHLSNWFLMTPSIATEIQYVNSPFFTFLLTHYMFRPPRDHPQLRYTIRCFKCFLGLFLIQRIRCTYTTWRIDVICLYRYFDAWSPIHLIVYLTWRWPVGAEICSEWEGK
jgi:hypothetical protein